MLETPSVQSTFNKNEKKLLSILFFIQRSFIDENLAEPMEAESVEIQLNQAFCSNVTRKLNDLMRYDKESSIHKVD
jgi:hypothetical protein